MANAEYIEAILKQIKQPLWENWYIREKIGSGSYSAVYKVEAKRMGRTDVSALKIEPLVPPEDSYPDEARKRRVVEERRRLAVNESDIMFALRSCPNIVEYQEEDVGELYIDGKFEGYYFLIRMEYLSCLGDLIKNNEFDFSEANLRKLAADIAAGVKAAHDKGVIHRDLKPANFFRDANNVYKLGDFNIAKKADVSGTFAGTNGYLAPEVFFARSSAGARYDKQADVYSFGISLYQLANDMYFPFERELQDPDLAIDKRMNGEPLPLPANVSPEFARIILKACAFNTADRYRSMDEILADLSAAPAARPSDKAVTASTVRMQETGTGFGSVNNPFTSLKNASAVEPSRPRPSQNIPRPAPAAAAPTQAKKRNNAPIIAALLLTIVVAAVGATIYVLAKSSSGKSDNSGNGAAITEMSASVDSISIGLYEDVEITDATFPDTVSKSAASLNTRLQTGYVVSSTLYATNDQLLITVNDDAEEELKWDSPKDLKVSVKEEEDGVYRVTFNAENYLGRDAACKVVFYCDDQSVYKTVQVNIKNEGPFQDEVAVRSADPDIITIYEENGAQNYKIHSTGVATINWIYNGEIKYSKEVTVAD